MASQKKPFGDVPPEFTEALARFKTAATNAVNKIAELRAKVKTSMTAEEVRQAQGIIDSVTTQLEGAAAEVEPPPPEPTP